MNGDIEKITLAIKPGMSEAEVARARRRMEEMVAHLLGRERAESAKAEQALRHAERELAIKTRMAEIFLSCPGDEMYGEVLQVVLEVMESKYGVFAYIDEDGTAVAPSMTKDVWEECQIPGKDIRFPRETWGESIWARAIREKRSLYSNQPGRVPQGHIPIDRVLVVPILYQGEVIGHLEVANKATDYDEEDKERLETIASKVAPILAARLQRDRQEKERTMAEEEVRRYQDHLEEMVEERTATLELLTERLESEIVERKQMYQTSQDSEERYRNLAENALVGIYQTNLKGDILYANQALARMFEFESVEELQSIPVTKLYKDPKRREVLIESLQRSGRLSNFELEFLTKTGKPGNGILSATLSGETITGMILDITERRLAEEAVRQSEERYRAVVEQSPDAIFLDDLETRRILDANPAFQKLLGYSSEEILSLSIYDIVAADRQDIDQRFQQILKAEGPFTHERKYRKKDGSLIDVWISSKVISYEERMVTCALVRDLTQRNQAEAALRESEERYRAIMEQSADAIFLVDPETRHIVEANASFHKLLGYSAEQVRELSIYDFVAAPREDIDQKYQQILMSGGLSYERQLRRKDGSVIDVWINSTVISYGGKEVACAVVRDLTERKRAEEKVREQASLIDISRDAINVRSLDGRIVFWSRGAERILGWKAEEVLDKKANELLYDKAHQDEPIQALKVTLEQGVWSGELHVITKESKEVILDSQWTLVRDEMGRPRSILVVSTDVTDKKKLEAQFLRAQRMEAIGRLAAGVAHDLNNVLAPILMLVELLKGKIPDGEAQQMLSTIESSASRGASVVKQVLTFARGAVGERIMIDPKYLIKDTARILRETLPPSIQIRTDFPKDLWALLGDPAQLHQVLMNLCVNARDAMPDGGELTLQAQNLVLDETYARMNLEAKPGSYVLLSVSDTGRGIPSHLQDKIFEPFFTTKELGKGTGLGLSTVAAIAKSHGGFVKVYSELGKGSEFKVYLPAQERAEAEKVEERAELPSGQGELILVVDDEAFIRDVTKQTLETYGYRVISAADGAEAITVYIQNQQEIKAVLLDMMMPYMDGPATIRALQKIYPEVRIIASSGLAANGKRVEAERAPGVRAFLLKPYTAGELVRTLREVLSGS